MKAATTLRTARKAAGLTQAELAARAGTSQATLSQYESGSKQPEVATLQRLLRAVNWELTAAPRKPGSHPTSEEIAEVDRRLVQVLELAELLPVRHERELRFPRLPMPMHQPPS